MVISRFQEDRDSVCNAISFDSFAEYFFSCCDAIAWAPAYAIGSSHLVRLTPCLPPRCHAFALVSTLALNQHFAQFLLFFMCCDATA